MSKSQPQAVFTVTFGCSNCGNEWDGDFPPLTTVDDGTRRTQVLNDECDTLGIHNCNCCNIITCTVCDRADDVYVESREPITDEEE